MIQLLMRLSIILNICMLNNLCFYDFSFAKLFNLILMCTIEKNIKKLKQTKIFDIKLNLFF